MASDALGIMLGYLVENNIPLPTPSDLNAVSYDPEKQFVTLVSVDLKDYLRDTELDKKTIQVPHWLNVRATKEKINFSQTMTEALVQKLNI